MNDKEGILNDMAICAGYGGLELALKILFGERYQTVCYCEREAYAAANLVARMEDQTVDKAPVWDCVETFEGRRWRGRVDILTAGYPCQPFSSAGKRRGAEDPRHTYPHISRIIDEAEPALVWFENVSGHLTLGYPEVKADLEAKGYRVKEGLFTAFEIGANQKRQRLFILAKHMGDARCGGCERDDRRRSGRCQTMANTSGFGRLAGAGLCSYGPGEYGWNEPGHNRELVAYSDCNGLGRLLRKAGQRKKDLKQRPDSSRKSVRDGGGRSPLLANTNGQRLQGPIQHGGSNAEGWEEQIEPAVAFCGDGLPPFPPGPNEIGKWREILKIEPSVEPSLRRMADGGASWMDRIQLAGNGVFPLVAAYAFSTLLQDLAREELNENA